MKRKARITKREHKARLCAACKTNRRMGETDVCTYCVADARRRVAVVA